MKRVSLRVKLVTVYFLLAILPILAISLFSFQIYTQDTEQIEDALMDYAVSQVVENVSVSLTRYKSLIAEIATDDAVVTNTSMMNSEPLTSQQYAIVRNGLLDIFGKYVWSEDAVIRITFLSDQLYAISYDRLKLGSGGYVNPWWESVSFREKVLEYCAPGRPRDLKIFNPLNFEGAGASAAEVMFIAYPATDFVPGNIYGMIVLELDSAVFTDTLSSQGRGSFLDSRVSDFSCVTDSGGLIVACPSSELVGHHISDIPEINPDITSHKIRKIANTELSVNLFFQRGALQSYTENFKTLVLTITLALLAIFFFVVYAITSGLRRKIDQIAFAMEEFGENLTEVGLDIDKDDEILSVIDDRFHRMTTNVSRLMQELKAQNQIIVRESDQRRQAEIKALQAQINPHFLYNALDRINWMAIENDQEEISETISGLGRLLRYSVSNVDMEVPLESELAWMKQYIFIQMKRFESEITLQTDVSEEALAFPIYKMLLQPLVENCILHGMRDDDPDFTIWLDARVTEEKRLAVTLADNGLGMTPECLEEIRAIIREKQTLQSGSIGVSNVVNRMWLYYGELCEIRIDSQREKGTTIHLVIPSPGSVRMAKDQQVWRVAHRKGENA